MLRYDTAMRLRFWWVAVVFCVLPLHDAQAQLRGETYLTGLNDPIAFVQDPTDRSVQFVVQQGGRIRAIRNGSIEPVDFLNLTASVACCGERGLLGLAFTP